MRRFFVIAVVLLSLAFQGVSVAGPRHATGEDAMSHELLHLNDVPHHHHDGADGEDLLMFDHSAESVSHLASDGAFSSPAIAPVITAFAVAAGSMSLPIRQFIVPSGPDLQGLRKPPREIP